MEHLPLEIVGMVASHLTFYDYLSLRLTCRHTGLLPKVPRLCFQSYKKSTEHFQLKHEVALEPRYMSYHIDLDTSFLNDNVALYLLDVFHGHTLLKIMQCRDRRISDTCKEKILERILDLDFHYIKMLSLNFLLQSWRFVSDRIELSSKHCISTDEKWTIADQAGLRCHTIIKILMEENRIDFGKFKDKIAHVASRYNDLLLLKKMVDLGADMSSGNDYALRLAAEHGHEEIVAYLLQNQSVQPNTWNNFPIRIACSKGHHKVVELLLRHPKVDSQAFGHQPLYSAAEKGHNEVVQLLLSTPSDDHTNVLLGALKIASANGHLSIVELLMQHCNNISKDDLNFSLKMAAMNGFTDVVLYFIGSHGKDLNLGEALQAASQRGRIDVVALLLPKCSTEDIQKAITCARIGRKTMVLEYLLACVT